jgi:hypothetical protein
MLNARFVIYLWFVCFVAVTFGHDVNIVNKNLSVAEVALLLIFFSWFFSIINIIKAAKSKQNFSFVVHLLNIFIMPFILWMFYFLSDLFLNGVGM